MTNADPAPSAVTDAPEDPPPGTLRWMAAGVTVTTALAIVAAHVPARVRLLGLFSIAFGLLVGGIMSQLAQRLKPRASRPIIAGYPALLTLAGLIGGTLEIHRLDALNRKPTANELLALQMSRQMNELPANTSGATADSPGSAVPSQPMKDQHGNSSTGQDKATGPAKASGATADSPGSAVPSQPMKGQQGNSSTEQDKAAGPANALADSLDTSFRRHLARRVRQLGDLSTPWPELIWTAELLAGMAASYWIGLRSSTSNEAASTA